MNRLPDWRSRLAAYAAEAARKPFRPGQHDCALFAAGAVEAMTGTDPAAELRGTYRSIEEGHAALQEMGHADHVAMADALFDGIPVARACVGDLAAVRDDDGGLALGVVQGPHIWALRLDGLGTVPLTEGVRAWRV